VTSARAGLPSELAVLIQQCLAKDTAERFQSAKLLAKAIQQAARNWPPAYPASKPWRSRLPTKASGSPSCPSNTAAAMPNSKLSPRASVKKSSPAFAILLPARDRPRFHPALYRGTYRRASGRQGTRRTLCDGGQPAPGRSQVACCRATCGRRFRLDLWADTYDRASRPKKFSLFKMTRPPHRLHRCRLTRRSRHSMSEAVRNKRDALLTPHEAILRVFGYHERLNPEEHAKARDALERAVRDAPEQAIVGPCCPRIQQRAFIWIQCATGFARSGSGCGSARGRSCAFEQPQPSRPGRGVVQPPGAASLPAGVGTAIALNRMDSSVTAFQAMLQSLAGDWERGCVLAESAIQLNPHHPGYYWTGPCSTPTASANTAPWWTSP